MCRLELKLDCGRRVCIANSVVSAANEVLAESTALFNCYFQNSSFCWSRKELENFEFFQKSTFKLNYFS